MPGLDQPGRLKARDGLAHHRATHAECLHERSLGGELAAGGQVPATDIFRQLFHHFDGKAAWFAAGLNGCIHREFPSFK